MKSRASFFFFLLVTTFSAAQTYTVTDLGTLEVHPFRYSNGKMTDLGTLGSHTAGWWNVASGINKFGVVVGTSYDASGNFFGFTWANGKMTKMGTLCGSWSQAYAINNKGQITGLAYTANGSGHAFITGGTNLIDLGTFAGSTSTTWGFGINNLGVVVGQSTFQNTYHAFVFSGGKIKDLNKQIPAGSGWTLTEADGINDAGQIVGMGLKNGQQHAY